MILLDANVIIRLLTVADNPANLRMQSIALEVLESVEAGDVDVLISDVVLAEVAFMMTSRKHFATDVADFVEKLMAIVSLRNVRVDDRQTLFRALALWSERPNLGFIDAMTAAQAQRLNVQLLTFDSDFDGIEGIQRWEPPEETTSNQ
ncbi:MAG: PIN domain-containing protein [Thermomicrobiales bacterium]|nr:PIN domain-containing protein [Thermomicrobiales bacterium]